jgi:hypothetical protein
MDKGVQIIKRTTDHSRTYTHSNYEESKEVKRNEFTTPRDSYKYRKRSRSSRKYSKYSHRCSPQHISIASNSKLKESGSRNDRKRDLKYSDKRKEDDFKVPSKFSMASSENRRRKEK